MTARLERARSFFLFRYRLFHGRRRRDGFRLFFLRLFRFLCATELALCHDNPPLGVRPAVRAARRAGNIGGDLMSMMPMASQAGKTFVIAKPRISTSAKQSAGSAARRH